MNRKANGYPNLQYCLKLSTEVAKKAATDIFSDQNSVILADFERDIKIRGDIKLNEIIVNHLTNGSPYPVFSEEGGNSIVEWTKEKYRWIVDPLDGSLNFSRGIPLSCVSIAFWKSMEPLVGVVYDFNRDELFTGVVGEGACVNGKGIRVGCVTEERNAVLCTGFPVSTDFSERALLRFVRNIQSYKKVRLLGSAALSLAYVASGRADVYEEHDIALWDVAAGIAIVMAAGGVVEFYPSKKINRLMVKAIGSKSMSLR